LTREPNGPQTEEPQGAAGEEEAGRTAPIADEPKAAQAEVPAGEAEPGEKKPAAGEAARAEAAPRGAPARPERRRRGRPGGRRKVCAFCVEHVDIIDYKDPLKLRRYLSDRGRIEPRRKTGTCAKHQRRLSVALKRARHLALLPYTAGHIRETGVLAPRS
jgi:small subunit ribosomal protein S18